MKRPPDKKFWLTVAMLIVVASAMLTRPAAAPADPIHTQLLGGR